VRLQRGVVCFLVKPDPAVDQDLSDGIEVIPGR
jgi:hypothetical protein